MMNNKGVTLVELIIVIVIIGIISAFTVPAVGRYLENAQKSAVLEDARQIRNAADNYCNEQGGCAATTVYTWTTAGTGETDISDEDLLSNFSVADYEIVRATKTTTGWTVILEATGDNTGNWEFNPTDATDPINADNDDVTKDTTN
jgi:type IV pilus assembly protein PilA